MNPFSSKDCSFCTLKQYGFLFFRCTFERKLTVYQLFAEYKDSLIIILLEDIPDDRLSRYDKIHRTLKKKTYLQWPPENGIERHTFWVRLKAALRGNVQPENNDIDV